MGHDDEKADRENDEPGEKSPLLKESSLEGSHCSSFSRMGNNKMCAMHKLLVVHFPKLL
jgi:hypothetical protein